MRNSHWKRIVFLSKANNSLPPIKSTKDAAVCLLERWPSAHGQCYKRAIVSCTKALTGEAPHEAAEAAFLTASMEAEFRIDLQDWFEMELAAATLEMLQTDISNSSFASNI